MDKETAELVETLIAISVVAKVIAKKLMEEGGNEEDEDERDTARCNHCRNRCF